MMFGFRKQTLKQKRIIKRKKYLQGLIIRLTERKALLELEIEKLDKDIVKAHDDLKYTLRREGSEDEV